MSGRIGLVIILVAFILGSVFGCLFLGDITKSLNDNGANPTEACILCNKDQAKGRPVTAKITKDRSTEKDIHRSAEIVEFLYDVSEGQEERLVIKTVPGDICTVRYLAPNKSEPALDKAYQVAGEDGLCQWTWKVSPGSVIPNNNLGTVIYWASGNLEYLYFTIIPQVGFQQ